MILRFGGDRLFENVINPAFAAPKRAKQVEFAVPAETRTDPAVGGQSYLVAAGTEVRRRKSANESDRGPSS